MVESFASFLKKEKKIVESESAISVKEYFELDSIDFFDKPINVIPIEALGNWAWSRWIKTDFFWEEVEWFLDFNKLSKKEIKEIEEETKHESIDGNYSLVVFAVACLGKQEIKKRLKELHGEKK